MTTHGTPIALVTFNGIPVPAPQFTTTHSIDQQIGIATIYVPAHIEIAHEAEVEIQAGYRETGTSVIFRGTITRISWEFDKSGKRRQVSCDGYLRRLNQVNDSSLVFAGRNQLYEIARSLTNRIDIPVMLIDSVVDLSTGTPVVLGGNEFVDDGNVPVPRRQRHLSWLTNALEMFGYRLFERPAGDGRVMLVSGLPSADTPWSISEGVDAIRLSRTWSRYDRADYVDVTGASWTDADGVANKIRSFPAVVAEPDWEIATLSSDLLVNQGLADLARNVIEINRGEPSDVQAYRTAGLPNLQPGDTVMLTSASLDIPTPESQWVMRVHHEFSDRGFWTSVDLWSGAGVPLAGGVDSVTIPVATGPIHLGDEVVPWYAAPNPSGKSYKIPFTVPDEFTAIVLEWLGHGSNSDFTDGASSELTVSKIILWQGGEEIGKVDLPVLPEDYEKRLPYSQLEHWTRSRRSVGGRLKAGTAELEIVSGEIASRGHVDDFEVRDVVLTLTGIGHTVVPEVQ